MKIRFVLGETPYNCELQVTDTFGTRCFLLEMPIDEDQTNASLEVDIYGYEFDLTLIPIMVDYQPELNNLETRKLKDKFVKKTLSWMLSSFENAILRVGTKYHITNIQNMDVLNIDIQAFAHDTSFIAEFFDFMPVMYTFYEVSQFGNRFELTDVCETNRKSVLKTAKTLAFTDFGIHLIFTYPIQVGRVKHLTKTKKIFKTLHKYHNMDEEKRQKLIDKFEKD